MDKLKKLGEVFSEMVDNYNSFGASWKNIPLGKEAFRLMKDKLPLRVEGELTPYTRIVLLDKMISCMPERDCARFMKEVRDYQKSMFPLISADDIQEDMDIDHYEGDPEKYVHEYTEDDLKKAAKKVEDYLDTRISMEEWCRTYGVHLKFDPVERTEKWENCIYDVEERCDRKLKDERKGMGYCYSYWSTKKAVLAEFGIEWDSPAVMNPRVMFD
ncbi:MAG: hypothetical protein MJZ17_06035 [Bacteroidales bacterium]|nr:hypothetical protein [Bacteroidales bacterium]